MRRAIRLGLVLAGLLAILAAVGMLSVVTIGSVPVAAVDVATTPQAYLPFVARPQPTPFTPPISVQRYQIEYAIETDEPYVWMPAPRYWDGNGVRQLAIQEISPPPTDRYRESNRTEIVYWENPSLVTQTFKVILSTEIGAIEYGIDPNTQWPQYDVNSYLYQKNITATTWAQVADPEIQNQAAAIVGGETNPYRKAQMIHSWIVENMDYLSGVPDDALSTLRNGGAACGGKANLFVALCRASGIPARNVAGIHSPGGDELQSGTSQDRTLALHVWAEFYLPGLGWIQVDPGSQDQFARIVEHRLPTSKGNDIYLGHGHSHDELSWFHVPFNAYTQLEFDPLWLTVTQLP